MLCYSRAGVLGFARAGVLGFALAATLAAALIMNASSGKFASATRRQTWPLFQKKSMPTSSHKPQKTARAAAASAASHDASVGVRVLKKYPNRRLYDTATSTYITLAEVKALVMAATPFVVRDAKTDEDLTRSILLQVILEEEAGGSPIFTEAVLANIIRFYGHTMQGFFGANLESSIQAFADMQKKMMEAAPGFGVDAWQKMMQDMMGNYTAQPTQIVQQMQEQMQRQYQANMQQWMAAFQTKR